MRKYFILAFAVMVSFFNVMTAHDNYLPVEQTDPIVQTSEPDPEQTEEPDPEVPDEPLWPASMVSGTLPVMYINTVDATPIVDKETKIPAGLWIEIPEQCPDTQFALGSEDEPISLVIKGRGNSTWSYPKKPYKLKFDSKTAIMGMPKHKHFALLAHYGNNTAWLGFAAGFEMARMLGMPWAPRFQPVELVLNGSYEGLYFLTESLKIDKNRLNIYEQPEENTDPETIPYGWLVEIDNYADEYQTLVPYTEYRSMRVTQQSPEILSEEQSEWLYNEFSQIVQTITNEETVEDWVNHFDAQSLARYFIVRELLNDVDGFNGSMYLHKDLNEEKWTFGPMWDCTLCFLKPDQELDWTKNVLPDYVWWKFLPEIFNTKNFNEAFLAEWEDFYPEKLKMLEAYINPLFKQIEPSFEITRERWGNAYSPLTQITVNNCIATINKKAEWMDEHKEFYNEIVSRPSISVGSENVQSTTYYTPVGASVTHPIPGNLYLRVEKMSDGSNRCTKIRY